MSGDTVTSVIATVMMLVLVGSSLAARRLNVGQTLRMAMAWSAIFAIVFVLFLFREEGKAIWARAKAEIGGGTEANVSGQTTVIRMGEDGHFHVRALVNGHPVDFLVDSGATYTGLTDSAAKAADVEPDSAINIPIDTANGTVMVSTSRIATLVVGNVQQRDARAVIGKSFGDTNVLGMSFLSELKSWKVEGRTLTLQP